MEPKHSAESITVQEAARSLGVSTKTIQRYLARGLLTKVKEGARTLVLVSELDALNVSESGGRGQEKRSVAVPHRHAGSQDPILLARADYEALLLELGQLRKERELQGEFMAAVRKFEERITALQDRLSTIQNRLEAAESSVSELSRKMSEAGRVPTGREGESASTKLPKPWWQK